MRHGYRRQKRGRAALIIAILLPVCLLCLVPLWIIIAASFTDDGRLAADGYRLWPRQFSLEAYHYLLVKPQLIVTSYEISLFVTVVGTVLALSVMAMLAYPMSRRGFRPRNALAFYIFFTMLFSGGLVPTYILITRYLHLKNNILVLILPLLVNPFYVLLLRTYFRGLPEDLFDAAKLDGAGEFRVFTRIAIPLSTPALATVGLLCMLDFWNNMYLALLYIDEKVLYPLQYLLYILIDSMNMIQEGATYTGTVTPYLSVRMAMAVLTIAPVLLSFLFIQRYFVRGITLGGLKGD
jgi:putative aldouronate transport system permease protein